MSPLLKLANYICSYPPYNFEDEDNKKLDEKDNKLLKNKHVLYTVYAATFGSVSCILWILCIFRFFEGIPEMNITVILEMTGRILYILLCIIVNFGVAFWNRKKYPCILGIMSSVEKHFNSSCNTSVQPKYNFLILDITLVHVIFVSFNIVSSYFFYPLMKNVARNVNFEFIFVYFSNNFVIIHFLVIFNLIASVNCKFVVFNEKLLNVYKHLDHIKRPKRTLEKIQQLQSIFCKLTDLVNLMNDTFGYLFLVMSLIILRNLLSSIEMAISLEAVSTPGLVLSTTWAIFTLVSFLLFFNSRFSSKALAIC